MYQYQRKIKNNNDNNTNIVDKCNVLPSHNTNFTLAGLHSEGSSDDSDVYSPFTQYLSSENDVHGIEGITRNTCLTNNNMATRANECAQLTVMGSDDNINACNTNNHAIHKFEP